MTNGPGPDPDEARPPEPYGQPDYGQPDYGQPDYGQPTYSRLPATYGQFQPYPPAPVAAQAPPGSGMYVAAAVINWVILGLLVLGTCGAGIIAAAWFVPMTIRIHRGARDPYKHTALGVCTLLFCSLVSGILMLIADGNRRERPAG